MSLYFPDSEEKAALGILIGAFAFAFLGLFVIHQMETKLRVKSDAALCFVLSSFFGLGILIASRIQITHVSWYKKIQLFLYGQSATMTDIHILIYGALSLLIIAFLLLLFRSIKAIYFDVDFTKSLGMRVNFFENMIFLLLVLAICIGIRSVGVVLMSGMLIAPAIGARQYTHKLSLLFVLSGFFGMFSGFFGNYLSVFIPLVLQKEGEKTFSLPTGPMILLFAAFICALSFLVAPHTGLLSRSMRIIQFRRKCVVENALKTLWKKGIGEGAKKQAIFDGLKITRISSFFVLLKLVRQGWVEKLPSKNYQLTPFGFEYASRIVRLHRLWEVYLVSYLGQKVEKVHRNAEEMEHIITPELERELTELLKDPKIDPHKQPIPAKIGEL